MGKLGKKLKEARKVKGVSLADAAATTKIKAEYLQMLEAEQFERLPPPAYVRGFLKIYARFLGLDQEPLLKLYNEAYRAPEPKMVFAGQRRVPSVPFLPAIKWTHLLQFIGGAAFLVLIVLGLLKLLRSEKKMISPATEFAIVADPYTSETIERISLPPEMAAPPAPAASSLKLEARAKEDVWLEVYADGGLVFYSTLRAGRPTRWEAEKGYRIRVGNPRKICLLLNGEEITFPEKASSATHLYINWEGIKIHD